MADLPVWEGLPAGWPQDYGAKGSDPVSDEWLRIMGVWPPGAGWLAAMPGPQAAKAAERHATHHTDRVGYMRPSVCQACRDAVAALQREVDRGDAAPTG